MFYRLMMYSKVISKSVNAAYKFIFKKVKRITASFMQAEHLILL